MDGAWVRRARWRWRGAWLWPAFVTAVLLDGVIAVTRPFAGERQSFYGGLLTGMVLNTLAVLLLSAALGRAIRGRRRDMPVAVARNYGGAAAVAGVTGLLLAIGLARHGAIVARQATMRDAIVRAEAYIGDHAPSEFRSNSTSPDTFTIQAGTIYRVCVPSRLRPRYYCVIVRPRLPFAASVEPAGSEPNWSLALGTD